MINLYLNTLIGRVPLTYQLENKNAVIVGLTLLLLL